MKERKEEREKKGGRKKEERKEERERRNGALTRKGRGHKGESAQRARVRARGERERYLVKRGRWGRKKAKGESGEKGVTRAGKDSGKDLRGEKKQ